MAVSRRYEHESGRQEAVQVLINGRFVLEGIPTILVGVGIWFYLPDYPETAKFLTEKERQFASDRMGPFAPKGTDKHFDKDDFWKTIKAWDFWAFALCYFFLTNSLNAFGFFVSRISQPFWTSL